MQEVPTGAAHPCRWVQRGPSGVPAIMSAALARNEAAPVTSSAARAATASEAAEAMMQVRRMRMVAMVEKRRRGGGGRSGRIRGGTRPVEPRPDAGRRLVGPTERESPVGEDSDHAAVFGS